ncbi:transposase [Limnoglobus roseus]|uniref:IS5/IS1182 family transposase n=1 Tax=Limnoglobus roseus TaxID=2598579 RepID=A0A5C1AN07_9BACT|nr:IS5/IS1182 family transposase [Limnoglobus roseus]
MRHRHEPTDPQWETTPGLLPGKAGDPGRTAVDNRRFANAVLSALKTGIPWADRPTRFGKPNTVGERFDRWCAAGVRERIAKALGDPDREEVPMDSTTVKAHPVASAGRRLPRGKEAADEAAAGGRPSGMRRSTDGVGDSRRW